MDGTASLETAAVTRKSYFADGYAIPYIIQLTPHKLSAEPRGWPFSDCPHDIDHNTHTTNAEFKEMACLLLYTCA